jgi:glycosyltransferase involved in cell wall biosynthesis
MTRRLTVVQMLPELEEGGVECETVELAEYLVGQGHRSMVISGGGRMVPQLTSAGSIHYAWSHIGEKSPRCLQYLLPLRRLLMESEVDILHLRSRLPAWLGYLAWKSLPKSKRTYLVTTFHGFHSINAYSAIMAKGQTVVAVSRCIADHIKEAYAVSEARIAVIYGSYDARYFDPGRVEENRIAALRKQWGIAETTVPIILLPGRITRLKGHDFFIRCLARIRHLPWVAICTGDLAQNPDLAAELQSLLDRLKLSDRIRFTGYCQDMPAALKCARVVVSSSVKPESFGRIAVEAQAMETPVIATAHGGSLETVRDGETGWLVQPGNEEKMARALAEAVSDQPLCRRMGKKGRTWVEEQFTAPRLFEQTMAVYNRHWK